MPVIRNWRDQVPYIGHESKIIWPLLTRVKPDDEDAGEEACLLAIAQFTRHVVQGRITTDYHEHENKEQIYYFISGRGKMLIDGEEYAVTAGDSVHLPPQVKHQVINNTEDDIEYLNITGNVD
ncbi:MAG: cupin domain-containing protein [Candidatus Latescibacteria bacterium]|nr:cupin domain-containing protein [Candidatus Latescibacterota bacterium]